MLKFITNALRSYQENKAFNRQLANGLSLEERSRILANQDFKKLKKVIRWHQLSEEQFAAFLQSAPASLVGYYLRRHHLPPSYRGLIARLSPEDLVRRGLSEWMCAECNKYGMPENAYAALMSSGDDELIRFFEAFTIKRLRMERFLTPFWYSGPLGWCNWDNSWNDMVFPADGEIYDAEAAKHYLRHFAASVKIQRKIAAAGSPALNDVYLGAELLYNRVIEKLKSSNVSFVEEYPYVDPEIRKQLQ